METAIKDRLKQFIPHFLSDSELSYFTGISQVRQIFFGLTILLAYKVQVMRQVSIKGQEK